MTVLLFVVLLFVVLFFCYDLIIGCIIHYRLNKIIFKDEHMSDFIHHTNSIKEFYKGFPKKRLLCTMFK